MHERDTASAFRAILAGNCVTLAADIFSAETMPGLASRPVVEPIRYSWTVSRARSRPVPAADAFVAWAHDDASASTSLTGHEE